MEDLVARYRCPEQPGLVNYARFVANINQVFDENVNTADFVHQTKSSALFNDADKELMLAAVAHMNNKIKSERILLKPAFQDFDKSRQLHITQHQFLRVLKQLGLMPSDQHVFDLIIRKYCDRGTTAEVNYFKFVNDLDRPEDIFPGYTPKHPQPEPVNTRGQLKEIRSSFFDAPTDNIDVLHNRYQQPTVDISCDPNDVEDRLRSAVVMKRVRIEEFFHDYDKLRKGRVTKHQFHSILSQLNFNFTLGEYNALAARYETSDPEKFFNYVDFCASINKAFTTTGIDKAPTVSVAPLTQADTLLARRKYLQGTQTHEEGELAPVMDKYRREVAQRRINLKPQFQDFDRTRNGHVTKQQFLRVLDLLKISAPEHVVQAILRRYMDKGNVDEVNYVDFCEEVDGSQALYGVSQAHNHSFDYFEKTRPRQS